MFDSGVYDESYSDSCLGSEFEEDIHLKLVDDGDRRTSDEQESKIKNRMVLSEYSRSDMKSKSPLRHVRNSYNDLRIKEETGLSGRSDLGPLTGRFDKACRLSQSYYLDHSSSNAIKELISNSSLKKFSLSGLDLNFHDHLKLNSEDYDLGKSADSPKKREEFVESLKKLFDVRLAKFGSATGNVCSTASSDYSSNDRSGAEDSADESDRLVADEDPAADDSRSLLEILSVERQNVSSAESDADDVRVKESFVNSETPNKNSEKEIHWSEFGNPSDVLKEKDFKFVERNHKADRRVELNIEDTMPKLNWNFLEEQLEKAILKEKSCASQLRDEILRKMAVEAECEDEQQTDTKMYRMSSCSSCDNFSDLYHNVQSSEPSIMQPNIAMTTAACSFKTPPPSSIFRCPTRKSKPNQLQVCFVNEMSPDEDDLEATSGAAATKHPRRYLPSEYSTMCSEMFSGEEFDSKSLGVASQITKGSLESSKSSLHPLPALHISPKSASEVGENFFTRQARLQAEARIALAQVRPMSYMQFLLSKQPRRELDSILQCNIPGITKWDDLKTGIPQKMGELNTTHLQIIINHFLSEITRLNEELMNLLVDRDDLCIIQDSMLVDIEDFTRRAEEWEYQKLIGQKARVTPPTLTSSTASSSSHVLPTLDRC